MFFSSLLSSFNTIFYSYHVCLLGFFLCSLYRYNESVTQHYLEQLQASADDTLAMATAASPATTADSCLGKEYCCISVPGTKYE